MAKGHTQNIVLFGGSLDRDTISAAAWMAKNGLPIRVIQVEPRRLEDSYFLNVTQLIPIPAYEDFYIDVTVSADAAAAKKKTGGGSPSGRAYRIRLTALVEAGKVKVGDTLVFKNDPSRPAILKGANTVLFEGKDPKTSHPTTGMTKRARPVRSATAVTWSSPA